jgi:type I restriction enzyme S subunit
MARYAYYYLTACKDTVLVPLMQGTANMSMKVADIAEVGLPVPPYDEQKLIVSRLDMLTEMTREVKAHLDAVERDAEHLLAVRFRDVIAEAPLRSMAEVAPLVRREQSIDLNGSYPELGIRSFGKGTFHKPPLSGSEVGTKRLYRIEPGDLLFSNVFAWEGAIAIAQPTDASRFGSHRFITCRAVPELATAEFLRHYFLTEDGMLRIGEASPGGAGRNRTLGLEKLMAIEVPVPPLAAQKTFDQLQANVAALKARHAAIREANTALMPATLERLFSVEVLGHA